MTISTGRPRRTTGSERRGRVLALAALVAMGFGAWSLVRGEPGGDPEERADGMSQNGWEPISDGSDPRLVPFPWVTGRVRDGDVHTVLSYFAERFHTEVEPIDVGSSWGWDHRPVRGYDDVLSNHASGTAIDLNAPAHPLGSEGTFSDEQASRLRELLDELDPVLTWGGDFDRPDEMHFEVVGTAEEVAEVAARVAAP